MEMIHIIVDKARSNIAYEEEDLKKIPISSSSSWFEQRCYFDFIIIKIHWLKFYKCRLKNLLLFNGNPFFHFIVSWKSFPRDYLSDLNKFVEEIKVDVSSGSFGLGGKIFFGNGCIYHWGLYPSISFFHKVEATHLY